MSGRRARRIPVARLAAGAAAAALAALSHAAPSQASAVQDDPQPGRYFALPLAREARTLAEQASEHMEAQRWGECIATLQQLIEEHEAEVLPESYRPPADVESVHAAHPGAARWARRQLLSLPAEARQLYHDRFEGRAQRALRQARSRGDRRALVAVARRWPLTGSGIQALWTLGDLELEGGHVAEARIAWERADELTRLLPVDVPAGAETRRDLAASLRADDSEPGTHPEDPTLTRGPLPSSTAEAWTCELDLEPFDGPRESIYHHNLFPALAGDRVLVGSSLLLHCVDAFTGEREWTAGPPSGWERLNDRKREALFNGINRSQLVIRPAVGGKVAVAALRVPFSEEGNEAWQGIEIMSAIAQRRLYAFDLETGEELWNHAPRLAWMAAEERFRLEGAPTYAQSMLVAAPPVVAGSRVLVPCNRMQGRIDYHVACYELETGELLWSTSVVSGQRPRNMFGRAREEFAASPLAVAGDRVIAQTDLGTVAALDLMTGEILWESLYLQIALPKTRSYQPPQRPLTWRLRPPVVVGGVVVSTPSDSEEICALDLEDGRVLWSYPERLLQDADHETRGLGFNLLLGADEDTLYLAGSKIAAFRRAGGLAEPRSRFEELWTHALSDERALSSRLARALLCREEILVPLPNERLVLDRRTGIERRLLGARWSQYGNVLVDDGVIFTLSRESLHGFFDWEALFDRQRRRLAATPDDPRVGLDTARLYARRAEAVFEEGEILEALNLLRSAREILEPLSARLAAAPESPARLARGTTAELHRVLRQEARALEKQGQRARALEVLERARGLALSATDLRDTLLQEERILRNARRLDRHLAVLGELERSCADLPLPPAFLAEDGGALAGLQRNVSELLPWNQVDLPIGLWVLFTRAEVNRQQRRLPAALEDWHAVLARFGAHEVVPRKTAGAIARAAIDGQLLTPDGRAAYEPFEDAAAEHLEQARELGDAAALREVSRLYPHSRAALEADHARLELAYEAGDVESVAAIVYAMLESPGRERAARRPALLRLARAMGSNGNAAFERGLVRALAREAPDEPSSLAVHDGRSLAEVAASLERESAPQAPLLPRFDESIVFSEARTGLYEFLGRLVSLPDPESAPEEIHVYLVDERVEAYSSLEVERPAWSFPLFEPCAGARACAVSGGRIFAGGRGSIVALNAGGDPIWTRDTWGLPVQYLAAYGGIVVALVGADDAERALAFDAVAGIPLWDLHLGIEGRWRAPIFGPGTVVFFSQVYSKPARAFVFDLFRGTPVSDVELGMILNNSLDESAWIVGDKLMIPDFTHLKSRRSVTAYDLATGNELWAISLPPAEVFHSVARHAGETYLITTAETVGGSGGVYSFDAEFGALTRIVPLRVGEEPIGLEGRRRTELATPYLFTYTKSSSDRVPVRAIHLPYQVRWNGSLPVAHDELYDNDVMPLPAVSEACVALAYVTKNPTTGLRDVATMVFLDKNTGKRLDSVRLDDSFSHADRLELRGLGEALFAVGRARSPRRLRMQILEKIR